VDMDMVIPALQRAAALILEYAGGNGVSALTDIYPAPVVPVRIPVTYAYINKICGKTFAPATVQAILKSLRFEIEQSDEQGLTAIAPSCKPDVSQPADIAEEILRIDGLDQVPVSQRLNISLSRPFPNDRAERERTADQLCGMGFQEIVTNSIINSKYYPGREDLVRMLNSLSQDLDALRPSMLESGLEVIRYNLNRKSTDLALFEAGKTYLRGQEGYRETPCLALWLTGNVQPAQWNRPARPADIYYLKGVIENLLEAAGIGNAQVSYPEGGGTVQWKWKNRILCTAFAVDNAKLQEFDIRQEVYFAEIDWTQWTEALAARKIRYREIPKFPSVRRDLALVLDSSVQYEEVKRLTEQLKLEAMQSFELFDVFESDKLGAGKKSYALSYTFRLSDRTLTDQETGQMMEQLVKAYTSKLNAQIRE